MGRRYSRGRSQRRRSYWVHLVSDSSGINVAAGAQTNTVLFALPEDTNIANTLVRIVGSVYLGVQATPAFVACVYYGIYKRPTSAGDAFTLNPTNDDDIGSEEWLFWKVVNEFQADLVHHYGDDKVDIKVMRKLTENEELMSATGSSVAYHLAANLRGLFLAA